MHKTKSAGSLPVALLIGALSLPLVNAHGNDSKPYEAHHITEQMGIDTTKVDTTPPSPQQLSKINEIVSRIDPKTQKEFETAFSKWKEEWKRDPKMQLSSSTLDAKTLDSYAPLKAMGSKIIPLVISKMVAKNDFFVLVLYDDLQQDETKRISYKKEEDIEWILEGEQSRAWRTIKLWLQSHDK